MTNDELIKQYLEQGGKVTRVERNARRADLEPDKLKKRRLLEGLKARAMNVAG